MMNSSMLVGTVLGGVVATAVGAMAGYHYLAKGPEFADVLNVKTVTETYTVPREECFDQQVVHQAPVKDEHQVAGAVIGAVVGGLLGNQVGGGSGKKAATVAGAAAGGYAGKKVQEGMQNKNTYTTVERVCHTVQDKQQKVVGYDVEYKLGDSVSVVRMDHKPDARIPVKDGQLVLEVTASQ